MSKIYEFNELDALQLGQALRAALREKSPLKLTITRCAKKMEEVLNTFGERKNELMEGIVVKDGDGNMVPIEGLEGDPASVTDYQLSIPQEEAVKQFKEISEGKIEVQLPEISGDFKVLVGGEKITLEEYLDINPDASGSLAYIYTILTE